VSGGAKVAAAHGGQCVGGCVVGGVVVRLVGGGVCREGRAGVGGGASFDSTPAPIPRCRERWRSGRGITPCSHPTFAALSCTSPAKSPTISSSAIVKRSQSWAHRLHPRNHRDRGADHYPSPMRVAGGPEEAVPRHEQSEYAVLRMRRRNHDGGGRLPADSIPERPAGPTCCRLGRRSTSRPTGPRQTEARPRRPPTA
jgi:hypothetical protein